MEKEFSQKNEKLEKYVLATFRPDDTILSEIRERSHRMGFPPIQVGAMDGLHIEILTKALQPKKIVEIGTLTGYSGVCLLRGAHPEGRLYTLELDQKHAEQAKISFEKAGFKDRVQIFVGPATDNLKKIEVEGPFDLVFVDADKRNYPNYVRWAAEHLRPGGMVIADNTFAWGLVLGEDFKDDRDRYISEAMIETNKFLAQSGKFKATMIPTGEGLTVAIKN